MPEETEKADIIDVQEFKRAVIKIGKILDATTVEKSEKLLKLKVDFKGSVRTVMSGIRSSYSPDELVGKKAVFLLNLKPRKVMGVESEAMLLAASDDKGQISALVLDKDLDEGSTIS